MSKKAAEKDPDKRIYGPKMAKRIESLACRVSDLRERLDAIREAHETAVQPHLEADAQAAQNAQQEAEKKTAAEIAKQRALAAARRAKDLIEKNKKAVEAKRAAEAEAERKRQDVLRQQRERAEYQEQKERLDRERERISAALRMSREEAMDLLLRYNGRFGVSNAISCLKKIMGNIANDPGNKMYRRLRKKNKYINDEVLNRRGGEEILFSFGFRLRRIKVDRDRDQDPRAPREMREKVLRETLVRFYKTFAPSELPKVNIPQVVQYFAGEKEPILWDKLRQKYGKTKEDIPANYETDKNGEEFYVMDEPAASDTNASEWQAWFNKIKSARVLLNVAERKNREGTGGGSAGDAKA